MQIIPSLDIVQGKCIRLTEGRFETSKDYGISAVTMAERFACDGAKFLHVVDIEGARAGKVTNWSAIEELGRIKELQIQVGGGVRSDRDVERLLGAGIRRVVVGSVAVLSRQKVGQWAERFGPDRFCVAVDVKDGELAYAAWQRTVPISLEIVVNEMVEYGITSFLSTDVHRDGMMRGPNVAMYTGLVRNFRKVRWIASGGVDTLESLKMLQKTGVEGAVIGKAFYEGALTYEECVKSLC